MAVDTKQAALMLEKKRLAFLSYLKDIQEEISALAFAASPPANVPISVKKKKPTAPRPSKSKNRKGSILGKSSKSKKISNLKVITKSSLKSDSVEKPEESLKSMLTQESSSSTEIRILDEAFHNNMRAYKTSMDESKQMRLNNCTRSTTELPGFFQWKPINCGPNPTKFPM